MKNEEQNLNEPQDSALNISDVMNSSLRQLVKSILDDCKLDVDAIEESDPEFIGYIADEILKWHNEHK
jgi:hypothetical protein